ncbi:MAG: hypothetical protein CL798_06790 [Chromatiales bacterium]|nr:hypothetical protein [Chromatiales bacterium]
MFKARCLVGASSAALIVSGILAAVPLAGWAQIDEIVVSTRRKSESVQDVPIAIDAISSEQLQRQGISDISDITQLSTSVQFDQAYGPADVRIAVRGLSNTRGRSNVAFLVDNVDTTTENFISAGSGLLTNQRLLVDVERVEIVKGPQSALFGRAAFAGAISYTTKNPGDEFTGNVRVTAGDFGLMEFSGALGGPVKGLEDVLGIRVSGAYWTEDGYHKNSISGIDLGGQQGWGTAVTALFTPTDAAQIKWRTEYSDSKYDQRANVRMGAGTQGHNLKFYPYPIAPELIQGTSNTTTRLADFGQYCPDELKDPSQGPGICQSASYGNASGILPTLSEDPVTGKDYRGSDTQLFRTTLNMSFDFDFGTFSSITGFTDYDAFDELDQDYQAAGRPDTLRGHQQGRTNLETKQFSQEFRFASSFDGPLQTTFGALYWKEDRAQQDLNFIVSCMEYGKIPSDPAQVWPDPDVFVSGICDGTNNTISTWQEQVLQQFPCLYDATGMPIPDPETGTCRQGPRTGSPWSAVTEHKSLYFMLAWDLTDTWVIEFEDRFVWENFDLLRENYSSCANLFFPFGTTAFVPGFKEGPVTDASQDIACTNELVMNPDLPSPPADANGNDWFLLQGAEKSSYNTPKLTLRWQAADDVQTYFSWGIGQKPGGINTLAAGGTATTIDDERFDSEKVTAWEVGMKSEWEMAGFLRFNVAGFLNDYTDKQIGTQIVRQMGDDVALQPRIVNAAAAQVWGVELEAIWQPSFVDGLVLSANYTWLKAEITEFLDNTRSLIRAAINGECELIYKNGDDEIVPYNPSESQGTFCQLNLKGHRLERTPEHAFVGNIQFTQQLLDTGVDYFAELTGTYQGDRYMLIDNAVKFDSYWLVDTRLGLTEDNWEFLIYVNNLFDDDTFQTGGSGPDFGTQVTRLGFTAGLGTSHYFAVLPDPRTFGAMLTINF